MSPKTLILTERTAEIVVAYQASLVFTLAVIQGFMNKISQHTITTLLTT